MTRFDGFVVGTNGWSSCRSRVDGPIELGGMVLRRFEVDPGPEYELGCEEHDHQDECREAVPIGTRTSAKPVPIGRGRQSWRWSRLLAPSDQRSSHATRRADVDAALTPARAGLALPGTSKMATLIDWLAVDSANSPEAAIEYTELRDPRDEIIRITANFAARYSTEANPSTVTEHRSLAIAVSVNLADSLKVSRQKRRKDDCGRAGIA